MSPFGNGNALNDKGNDKRRKRLKDEKEPVAASERLRRVSRFLPSAGALHLEKLRLEKEPKKSDKRPADAA